MRFPLRFLVLLGVGGDLHLDDLVGVLDRAARVPVALLDRVDVLHAGNNLAPDRVLTIERRGWREADEELAVGAVRVLRARHRDGAADMLLRVELCRDLLPRAT